MQRAACYLQPDCRGNGVTLCRNENNWPYVTSQAGFLRHAGGPAVHVHTHGSAASPSCPLRGPLVHAWSPHRPSRRCASLPRGQCGLPGRGLGRLASVRPHRRRCFASCPASSARHRGARTPSYASSLGLPAWWAVACVACAHQLWQEQHAASLVCPSASLALHTHFCTPCPSAALLRALLSARGPKRPARQRLMERNTDYKRENNETYTSLYGRPARGRAGRIMQ